MKAIYVEVDDDEVYELIQQYRRVQGMNLKSFILLCIANEIYPKNAGIAEKIIEMMGRKKDVR